MLGLEFFGIAELFGFKRVARQVRAEIEVVSTQAESGPQNDFVENRSCGVDDQVAASCRADNPMQVAGIDLGYRNGRSPSKKPVCAVGVAVATPDVVSLTLEKLCQKGASRACPQYEDSHAVAKLYHIPAEWLARKVWREVELHRSAEERRI